MIFRSILLERPLPEPKGLEEGFQRSDLPYFKDDFFKDFRNTSKYSCQKRPPIPITPHEPLDDAFLKESIKELTALISSELVHEVEHSSKEIQICTASLTIQGKVARIMVDLLYNPTVGANLMSASFAHTYLGDEALALTSKHLRVAKMIKPKRTWDSPQHNDSL